MSKVKGVMRVRIAKVCPSKSQLDKIQKERALPLNSDVLIKKERKKRK
jgi:hypothetical protein